MIVAIVMLLSLPSVLSARWIKDRVYLQTEAVGKVEFSHDTHLAMDSIGKNCTVCHNDVFHIVTRKNPAFSMAQMEDGKACGFCHNGKKAFSVAGDCTTCHAGDIEFVNEDAGNIVFPHDVHTEMFSCDECHPDLFVPEHGANQMTMQAMEEGEYCGACHDGDTAFGVADDCESCHDM
jgi:c(7)-type cytochrome triheme protein